MNIRKILRILPDKQYIQLQYFFHFKRLPNLKNPKTFNEKLQWLKLHDRKPEYTTMVDKHLAKQYIAEKVGAEYVIPTLGVWETAEKIDFDALPNKFVLKWNHDSGSVVICRDKKTFDEQAAINTLRKGEDHNGYWYGREWPYKNVKPCIIAEKYLQDTEDDALTDYKFFCFDGEPKVMYISKDHGRDPRTDFFDMEFNHLNIKARDPNAETPPDKPACFDEMRHLAGVLSKGIPHLRVDFYWVNQEVYLGELTFYHQSGMTEITPPEWNLQMGAWIKLPIEKR